MPAVPIVKSSGVTPTERFLAELCERSFLRLWSYPNPYKEDGKELCDLLAVFEDHVFIFFDRESRRLETKDKDKKLGWERWKRAAVDDQARTAHGAERYLRSGRKIFLGADRSVEFPIAIDRSKMIVHKIIVAHGAAEACQAFSDANVYGSLAVVYGEPNADFSWPFLVEIDKGQPFHLLDSHNLPIILGELDTIFDLSSYLDAKIEAIRRYDGLVYCGEEDLLAHYFLNYDKTKNRHYIGTAETGFNGLMIGEGEWKDFIDTRPYKMKKAADAPSYMWDEIIQNGAECIERHASRQFELVTWRKRHTRDGERTAILAPRAFDCDDRSHQKFPGDFGASGPKRLFHAVLLQGQSLCLSPAEDEQHRGLRQRLPAKTAGLARGRVWRREK